MDENGKEKRGKNEGKSIKKDPKMHHFEEKIDRRNDHFPTMTIQTIHYISITYAKYFKISD